MMKPPCPSRKATAFWRSNYTASNSAATLNLQLALDGCSAARAPGVWPASATVPKSAYSMESNVVNTIAYYGVYIYIYIYAATTKHNCDFSPFCTPCPNYIGTGHVSGLHTEEPAAD